MYTQLWFKFCTFFFPPHAAFAAAIRSCAATIICFFFFFYFCGVRHFHRFPCDIQVLRNALWMMILFFSYDDLPFLGIGEKSLVEINKLEHLMKLLCFSCVLSEISIHEKKYIFDMLFDFHLAYTYCCVYCIFMTDWVYVCKIVIHRLFIQFIQHEALTVLCVATGGRFSACA